MSPDATRSRFFLLASKSLPAIAYPAHDVLRAKGLRFIAAAFAMFCLLANAFSSIVSAQDATGSLRIQAYRLLDQHWDRNSSAASAIDALASEVRSRGSSDAQVQYALGLAQLKQLRYRDAVASFEAAHRLNSADPAILKAVIWGQTLTRQPRQATVRLATFAETLEGKGEEGHEDLEFLGLMVGYLGLPIDGSVNARELESQVRKIEAILSAEQLAIFRASIDEVNLTYEELQAERTVEREDATVEAERSRELELERLANEKVEMKERATTIDAQLADVTQNRNQALGELRERDAPLQAQWNSAAANVRGLDVRIFDVQQTIWQLNQLLIREENPILRGRWLFEMGRMQYVLDNLVSERVAAASFADGIAAQRVALSNQYAAVQNDFDSQLNRLNTESRNLRRRQTISDARTRRLQGPLRVTSGRAESYGRTSKSLTTYFEFPLESERLRLMGEFSAPTSAPGDVRAEAEEREAPASPSIGSGDSLILDGRGR